MLPAPPGPLANGAGGSPVISCEKCPWTGTLKELEDISRGAFLCPVCRWTFDYRSTPTDDRSPAPTASEQAIEDRLLKPGEVASFESGLDADTTEYQCYLCNDWFFADQMKCVEGNRYCYSCRQQLPAPAIDDDHAAQEAPVYETTLFDEPTPTLEPDTNGRAPATDAALVAPPAMTQKDPYDEMLELASVIFPMLCSMQAIRTDGPIVKLRRFIDLFREIHQVKT